MTIFQLECYYALAQSLNFTQTASQQYITQPSPKPKHLLAGKGAGD